MGKPFTAVEKLRANGEFYMIIGKVIYGGLDAEGNIHLVLKNSNKDWAELAVKFLKSVEGCVVKVRIAPWRSKPPF